MNKIVWVLVVWLLILQLQPQQGDGMSTLRKLSIGGIWIKEQNITIEAGSGFFCWEKYGILMRNNAFLGINVPYMSENYKYRTCEYIDRSFSPYPGEKAGEYTL